MNSFRLRLDIGLDSSRSHREDAKPPPLFATAVHKNISDSTKSTDYNNGGERICPELDISYNDQTTFAHVLRDVIETHFLGGRLLDFLECKIPQNNNDGKRKELYVLIYSEDDATVLQPYWSSRWGPLGTISDGEMVHESVQQSLLQLSFGSGPANKDDEVIEPNVLVSSFVQKNFPNIDGVKEGNYEKKRRRNHHQSNCIDMKLTTKLCIVQDIIGRRPNKVNILLCEEHWREKGKLLQWNVLCKPRSSSVTNSSFANNQSRNTVSKSCDQHHPELKSFLIHNFLANDKLLAAIAFLIPTALIHRSLETFEGIQLSVDKPSFCQVRSLNLERPAVLRQYFGMDVDTTPDLPAPGRDDVVWRSCYGVGSGSRSVGIHPRYSTTREMTLPMKITAEEIYQYLRKRFHSDNSVVIHPFNHVTVLFYYQKIEPTKGTRKLSQPMLRYHTDNIYSKDGLFSHNSNSQMENTFTAVLTLGDVRELHFRRQETATNERKNKWISDTNTLPFSMEHGSLFLLHPHDEKPTQTKPNGPIHRYQHGHVKFPHLYRLSAALALRTVTSKEQVHKDTGKLFMEEPTLPQMLPLQQSSDGDGNDTHNNVESGSLAEPELDFLLHKFHGEKLIGTDERLKELWPSVCSRI